MPALTAQHNDCEVLPLTKQHTPLHVPLSIQTQYRLCFGGGLHLGAGTSNRAFHAHLLITSITDVHLRNVDLLMNKLFINIILSAALAKDWISTCTEAAATICVSKRHLWRQRHSPPREGLSTDDFIWPQQITTSASPFTSGHSHLPRGLTGKVRNPGAHKVSRLEREHN